MCVLHIMIDADQLDSIISSTRLSVYQVYKKGDKHKFRKNKVFDHNLISCDVSDKDWDDFDGQTKDMIAFLNKYHIELGSIRDNFKIPDWHFDLPYNCRLGNDLFSQNNFLPSELLSLAGYFGIGINLSLYLPSQDEEKPISEKKEKITNANNRS